MEYKIISENVTTDCACCEVHANYSEGFVQL
jgi:hypothetical protein